MSESLINIINALDLEELEQAVRNDDSEKEKGKLEQPAILKKFEKDFAQPPEYLRNFAPDEDFDAKLDLLLEFYANYNETIYTALKELKAKQLQTQAEATVLLERMFFEDAPRTLSNIGANVNSPMPPASVALPLNTANVNSLPLAWFSEHFRVRQQLEKTIIDRVSRESAGTTSRVLVQAMIGRIITPDQSFSSEGSDHESDSLKFKRLYDPLMPQNIRETMDEFFNAVLETLINDNMPFAARLENIFSLYKKYESILRSATEAFLYLPEMGGKSWLLDNPFLFEGSISLSDFIKAKEAVKEGAESFFTDEFLKQEIIAAYIKMLFQYLGNRITFAVKELAHPYQELLEMTVFQTISAIVEKNKGVESLSGIKNKEEEFIEKFKGLIKDRKDNVVHGNLEDAHKKLLEKERAIKKLMEEAEAIANEIERLKRCSKECDAAIQSMDSLRDKTPIATNSPALRIGTKKPRGSAVETSKRRLGGGLLKRATSILASTSSAPVEAEKPASLANPISAPVISLASPNSAPVASATVIPSQTITTSPHAMLWSPLHSGSISMGPATAMFSRHRSTVSPASTSPAPAAQEEQNISESSAVDPGNPVPTNVEFDVNDNDPVGKTMRNN